MAVGVESDAHVRVAESLLNDAGMDADAQRQRGVGVHRTAVTAEIGPTGLTGEIVLAPDSLRRSGPDWIVSYAPTEGINLTVAEGPTLRKPHLSRGTLDLLIGGPTSAKAAERVRKAIDRMAGGRWL